MNKAHTMPKSPLDKKNSFFDKLDENYYTEWFTNYGKTILISAAVLVAVLVIGVRLSYSFRGKNEVDYLKAQKEFVLFQKGGSIEELSQVLKRKPQLRPRYDGPIAQTLLNQNKVVEAKPFVQQTLLRTKKDNLPLYAAYSQITLLISEGQFDKALERTKELKSDLIADAKSVDRTTGDILFAYNLLRLALLSEQAGDTAAEKQTWMELKKYARLMDEAPPTDLFSPQAFYAMLSQFEEGKTSLIHYIDKRIN